MNKQIENVLKLILIFIVFIGSSIVGLKLINTLIQYASSFGWFSIMLFAVGVVASFISLGLIDQANQKRDIKK